MAASLNFFPPAVCLASELIDELSQWSQDELAQTLLVVPTQRLGTHILAGILEHHKALRTPSILTLERLLTEHGNSSGVNQIPESAVELILHQQLQSGLFTQLQVGHERELRLLHNELFEQGLRHTAPDELLRIIAEDIYKSETHLGSLHTRAQEIQAILDRLDEALEAQNLLTRSALLSRCADSLANSWPPESLTPYKKIVLVAYTSLAKSWRPVLQCLLQDSRACFWLHEAPELYHSSSPLKELVAWIRQNTGFEGLRQPTHRSASGHPPLAWVADSPLEEARWAVGLAKQWIAEGMSPHRIALLVSKESTYGPPLRFLCDESLDCNIALAQGFASLLPGRFLSSIHKLWEGDQEVSHLLGLIQHPSVEHWLFDGKPEPFALDHLREAILKLGIPHHYELMLKDLPELHSTRLGRLMNRLQLFHPNRQVSVQVWQKELLELVEEFAIFSCDEAADLLQSAEDLFESFLESLHIISNVSTGLMSGTFFWEILNRHLLSGDVRGTGEPLAGLQILSIPEARSMPFTRVILLGCQEGFFPQALPQDVLLDNYLKKAMGLPGWEVLESMEDQTFHLLLARLPQMILFRSKSRGDETVVRSRFTEALLVQGKLTEARLPLWDEAFPHAPIHLTALDDVPEGIYPEAFDQLWSTMSASRLERLIRCPYAFLLNQLGVQDFRPPPWEGDARREGVWLHAVLEAFVSGQHEGQQLLPIWNVTGEQFAQKALSRLMDLTSLLAPSELKDSPITRHLEQHAWPQFIAHLMLLGAHQPSQWQAAERELAFGVRSDRPVSVQVGPHMRLLMGRIDALDQFKDLSLVTDYKRRRVPTIASSECGTSPQLAFYAMAIACFDPQRSTQALLLGYWNIYEGTWHSHGINDAAAANPIARALSTRNTPSVEALKEGVIANWHWREEDVRRQQRFYADPSVCELCNFDGICRKEDPRFRSRILGQNTWEQRLSGHSRGKDESSDAAE